MFGSVISYHFFIRCVLGVNVVRQAVILEVRENIDKFKIFYDDVQLDKLGKAGVLFANSGVPEVQNAASERKFLTL